MASESVFPEMPIWASRVLLASVPMSLDELHSLSRKYEKAYFFFSLSIKCVLSLDRKSIPHAANILKLSLIY